MSMDSTRQMSTHRGRFGDPCLGDDGRWKEQAGVKSVGTHDVGGCNTIRRVVFMPMDNARRVSC